MESSQHHRINNNPHHICFWMLTHMLCDPSLLKAVRTETDAYCALDGSCDMEKLLTRCPYLDATWNEALRLYNASTTIRQAVAECHIGNTVIHSGDQVFAPARSFHLDERFFGGNPREFEPRRFLNDNKLPRSKGFIPFGGGHTYCPGRHFAKRETYVFLALTLRRFELQVTDAEAAIISEPKVPPVEKRFPVTAIMGPARDVFVTFRRREAVTED